MMLEVNCKLVEGWGLNVLEIFRKKEEKILELWL